MPFLLVKSNLDPKWLRGRRRVLLSGPPNSGKTFSLRTFLEEAGSRMAYVCYPGEQGSSTLEQDERILRFVWDEPDAAKATAWSDVWRAVEENTKDIISKKHGPVSVYAGDGLHKLHHVALCKVTAGEADKSLDFDAKLYDDARRLVLAHVRKLYNSDLDLVVFTVWEGWEKENPNAKDKDTVKHIYPAFPGKLAKEIMGEFPVALYAKVEGVGTAAKYLWQTRSFGNVKGCGIKGPPAVVGKIKTFVPQDWRALWKQLAYEPKPGEVVKPVDVVEGDEQPTMEEARA